MKKKETFKKEDSTIRDHVKKITDPIFNRVLKEKGITPESVSYTHLTLPTTPYV